MNVIIKPMETAAASRIILPSPVPRPKLSLTIQYATDKTDLPGRADIRKWVKAAQLHDGDITVRFVDAEEGRVLNRDFRTKDYATNVLTFTYHEEETELIHGDIVLCVEVLRDEASEQKKTLEAHCVHLIIHGILHLQGYDHAQEDEALEMEAIETQIMTELGYAAPYATIPRIE